MDLKDLAMPIIWAKTESFKVITCLTHAVGLKNPFMREKQFKFRKRIILSCQLSRTQGQVLCV